MKKNLTPGPAPVKQERGGYKAIDGVRLKNKFLLK